MVAFMHTSHIIMKVVLVKELAADFINTLQYPANGSLQDEGIQLGVQLESVSWVIILYQTRLIRHLHSRRQMYAAA